MIMDPRCVCGHGRAQHSEVFGLCKGLKLPLPPDWNVPSGRQISCECVQFQRTVYRPARSAEEIQHRAEVFRRFICAYVETFCLCALAFIVPLGRIRRRAAQAVYDYEEIASEMARLGEWGMS